MAKEKKSKDTVEALYSLDGKINWEYPKVCVNLQTDVR